MSMGEDNTQMLAISKDSQGPDDALAESIFNSKCDLEPPHLIRTADEPDHSQQVWPSD